ncbi:MAG: ATP synthase F1 subunit gamma [bacterium]|nr:ATP synthase F1 subunit gamma [bacterium]
MAKGTLDLKRKMKSVGNTKKVTKAMEMVSGAKMRKATASVLSTRPYSAASWEILLSLPHVSHSFFENSSEGDTALIVVSSNRGLCGSFNANIAQQAMRTLKTYAGKTDVYTLGKKATETLSSGGVTIAGAFEKSDITRSIEDVLPLAHVVLQGFLTKKYSRVEIIYTDFVSPLKQKVTVLPLLPFSRVDENVTHESGTQVNTARLSRDTVFEPSVEGVLDYVIPRIIETTIFQAVLESEASEHSARMLAMKNASEAATDLMYSLNRAYNQARQSAITQEIAEISAGRAALE